MSKTKQFLRPLLMAIVMLVGMLVPQGAWAAKSETIDEIIFLYNVEDDGITIYDYDNEDATYVEVPEKINGTPVTKINEYAFAGKSNLRVVVLPASITTLGGYIFLGTNNLMAIEFKGENPPAYIDYNAFVGVEALNPSIVVPEGSVEAYQEAFEKADIYDLNFVTEMPALPITVDDIKYRITDADSKYVSLYSAREVSGDITIPATISDDKGVEYTVTEVAGSAFEYNENLTSVTIPGMVQTIGDRAFLGCSNLATVTLSEGVHALGTNAFRNTALTSLVLPASLTSIDLDAFSGCNNLGYMVFKGNKPTLHTRGFLHNRTAPITLYVKDVSQWDTTDKLGAKDECEVTYKSLSDYCSDVLEGHTFDKGVCTVCNYVCEHTFAEDGVCTSCGIDIRESILNVGEGITVTFEDNGDYPWIVGNYGDDQIPALVTSNKNRNNSYSETTIKLNSQQNIFLSFDYAVSSESRYDKLTIWVDGKTVVNAISGKESASFPRTLLEANESGHTITLKYIKDSSGNGNDDCCYLYNFKAEAHEHTFTSFSHKCDVCGTIINHVHNFDSDYHCDMCDLSEPRFAIFNLEGASATFEDNGDYPWASGTYNETPAIVSTNVNGASSAISETTVKLNCQQNVVLSLDYAVSSMENKGSLTINLDGKTIVNDLSGDESGSLEGLYLSAGETPHTLSFIFKKGSNGINNNECGYIYNVKTVAHEHTFTSFTHKCDGCEYVKEHEHQMNSDNHCTLCNFYDPRNLVISVEGVTFAFVDNGNYPWVYTEIDNEQDGIGPLMSTPALKSTNEGKSSTNSELTINLTSQQAVNLSFDYAVSSEENYDKLIIEVDNRKVAEISGITNSSYSGVLPANTIHTITLIYSKDNSGNRENDCAYVYNIKAFAHSMHNYTVSSCDWSEDNTSATLHLACECGETADVEATVTTTVDAEPTCTNDGNGTVTATATYNDQTFTVSKPVCLKALGHDFEKHTLTTEPDEDGLYAYVCDREGCGGHGDYNIVKGDSNGNIFELTATTDGETTTYTATDVTIEDGKAFASPVDFTVTNLEFKRSFDTEKGMYTVMVPFAMTAEQAAGFGTFYTVDSFNETTETVTLAEVTGGTAAHTAYIFKPKSTETSHTFDQAVVKATVGVQLPDAAVLTSASATGLYGTYQSITAPTGAYGYSAGDGSNAETSGTINAGSFVKVGTGVTLPAYRAVLWVNGVSGASASPARLNVDLGDMGNSLGHLGIDAEPLGLCYDLNGRRVSEPRRGEVFIMNGRKFIIK